LETESSEKHTNFGVLQQESRIDEDFVSIVCPVKQGPCQVRVPWWSWMQTSAEQEQRNIQGAPLP